MQITTQFSIGDAVAYRDRSAIVIGIKIEVQQISSDDVERAIEPGEPFITYKLFFENNSIETRREADLLAAP